MAERLIEREVDARCRFNTIRGTDRHWQARHIFLRDGAAETLVHVGNHIMIPALENGAITGFFFIHYWEGGPHIRMRFRGCASRTAEVVRQLEGLASTDFDRAGRLDSAISAVVSADYVPELERYGVPFMELCELHFMVSSLAALRLTEATLTLPGPRRIPFALGQTLVAMVLVAQLAFQHLRDAIRFLQLYHEYWLVPKPAGLDSGQRKAYAGRLREEMLRASPAVDPGVQVALTECWKRSGRDVPGIPAATRWWLMQTRKIMAALETRGAVWSTLAGTRVLMSLVHMHANRLSIENRDESYLALIAATALKEIRP